MLLPVRLDCKGLPDAMHSRFRHPRLGGDLPDTPMRAVSRFGFQGPAHQSRHALVADRSGASGAQLIMQTSDPLLKKSSPPLTTAAPVPPPPPADLQFPSS